MTAQDSNELSREAHRRLAVSLFNRSWELLALQRTVPEDDELIHTVHASAHHWRACGGAAANLVLSPGLRVRHLKFGDGVITRIEGSGDEAKLAILFDAAEERTFMAGLLADKLEPA